jgi:acyl-CoA reductase-like NAD-dependent aldehyde dehydrogenase
MAAVSEDQRELDAPTGLLIDGEERDALSGERLDNINPATEAVLSQVASAGVEDVDLAVASSRAAFEGPWRQMPARERGRLMVKLAGLVERDAAKLDLIRTLENGTPDGGPEIPMTIDLFEYFGGWADKILGTVIPTGGVMDPTAPGAPLRPSHVYSIREPIGVVASIVPWNAPLLVTAFKLAPILASGCTTVVKTSEDSMQAVLYLGRLIEEAGFPPGVVNIINGRGAVAGAALVGHPNVAHVSFTGSPATGHTIAQTAAKTLKGVTLELGGKNPQIIFADGDVQRAAVTSAIGVIANQGQVCLSGSRILVEASIYEQVVEMVAGVAQSIKVGDPFDPDTVMGALISKRHIERVMGYIEAGKSDGARLLTGGSRLDRPGYFVEPTFFADASNDMRIAREEIFGPVGTIIPFSSEEEAVAMSNDTEYGLSATVWTNDVGRAHRLAGQLEVGAVSVNTWAPLDARVPHGGVKGSGVGRENGLAAFEDLTELKTVTVAL